MAEEARIGRSDPRPTTLTADGSPKPQVADISSFTVPHVLMSPGMAPILNPEYNENGAGIYAIQCLPYMSPLAGFSPKTLIPLKYSIPTHRYQTGALAPFIRWLQQAGAPPRHQRVVHDLNNNPQPGANNQDQPVQNLERVDGNQNPPQPEPPGNHFWRLVQDIQVFVVGFLTSLLVSFLEKRKNRGWSRSKNESWITKQTWNYGGESDKDYKTCKSNYT
ncbi:uncharacterized protein LOC141837441 [Curcuma longa]|uniref:uncharacterized protein LOC141837441 n=1 Tax=Curcuma longa TaxID=136217 RepID=UPI003D9EC931